MKNLAICLTALVAALFLMPAITVNATEAQDTSTAYAAKNFVLAAEDSGIYVRRTCSGEVAMPRPETYIFGLHDEQGACSTRIITANSYDEAYGCALKLCPDCRIEEITGMYMFGSSVPGVSDLRNYCPKR